MKEKCCKTCEHFREHYCSVLGICKEYEAFVSPERAACGWYCRKAEEKNDL